MGNSARPKRGLGRGLSSLLEEYDAPQIPADAPDADGQGASLRGVSWVPIDQLRPNPNQPRRDFNEATLAELETSIRASGMIQPLLVRASAAHPDHYEIIAGERRWRAAQRAQLHDVPVFFREIDDSTAFEIALIENIQREGLNPMEESAGYCLLAQRYGHSQERIARIVGRSRSHVANMMRLADAPPAIAEHLRAGRLTTGHARAILNAENPEALADIILAKGLNVRQAERLAAGKANDGHGANEPPPFPRSGFSSSDTAIGDAAMGAEAKDTDTLALEADISAALDMPVSIEHSARRGWGKLIIAYDSLEALDRLSQKLL